ncbi:MAG: peptide ABC transporter substrate-binding protein [Blautia sp.]|nr:peptide ABC transporter substrate-binding protein [Blautia sp.]
MKKQLIGFLTGLSLAAGLAAFSVSAAPEQVFNYALIDDPDSFDPGYTLNSFAGPVFDNCFIGLVKYDVNSEIVPGAAESWDVSEDGTVWTFHLVEGMKWSDGSDFTAADFEFAWQRVLTPEFGASGAYMLYNYIANAQSYYNGECEWSEVGVKALDDTTLEVTLASPCSYFIDLLATWTYSPVCKAVVEANPDWATDYENYVSNGPFKMVNYRMGEGIYLEKNDQYWLADNVKLEKINFKILQDLSTAFDAYNAGELDGLTKVPSSDIPTLKGRDDFYSITQFSDTYWMFNTTSEFLKDARVRKALAISIDRIALIEDVLQASYTPASGEVPYGYIQSDGQDFREAGGNYGITEEAQVEEAKALLAEAGYEDPSQITIRVCYYTNDTVKKVAEALASMWETNLGIKCEIESAEWTVFYDQILQLDYDVAAMGDAATYLNPMAFLQTYQGDNPPLETGWRNPDYDAALMNALSATDEAEADRYLHEAEDLFMNDYVLLPLYYGSTSMMMKDYVSNWAVTACAVDVFENIEILEH